MIILLQIADESPMAKKCKKVTFSCKEKGKGYGA